MQVKVEVLACQSGVSKKGNAYNIALVRVDDKVGKVFSDISLPVSNKIVNVDLDLSPNTEMFLGPRIRKVIA